MKKILTILLLLAFCTVQVTGTEYVISDSNCKVTQGEQSVDIDEQNTNRDNLSEEEYIKSIEHTLDTIEAYDICLQELDNILVEYGIEGAKDRKRIIQVYAINPFHQPPIPVIIIKNILCDYSIKQEDKIIYILAKLYALKTENPAVETDLINTYNNMKQYPNIFSSEDIYTIISNYINKYKIAEIVSSVINDDSISDDKKMWRIKGKLAIYPSEENPKTPEVLKESINESSWLRGENIAIYNNQKKLFIQYIYSVRNSSLWDYSTFLNRYKYKNNDDLNDKSYQRLPLLDGDYIAYNGKKKEYYPEYHKDGKLMGLVKLKLIKNNEKQVTLVLYEYRIGTYYPSRKMDIKHIYFYDAKKDKYFSQYIYDNNGNLLCGNIQSSLEDSYVAKYSRDMLNRPITNTVKELPIADVDTDKIHNIMADTSKIVVSAVNNVTKGVILGPPAIALLIVATCPLIRWMWDRR